MTNVAFSVVGLLVAIGSSTVARAEAPAPGGRCAVEIARAPDEAHEAIARWVAQEPRCGAPLTVRVVPTADGLYVLAQAADGRTFERVVPDAEAAGVLVASWAARVEDQAAARAPVVAPGVPAVAPARFGGSRSTVAGARDASAWRGVRTAAGSRSPPASPRYDTVGRVAGRSARLALAGAGRWSHRSSPPTCASTSVPLIDDSARDGRAPRDGSRRRRALQGAWTLHAGGDGGSAPSSASGFGGRAGLPIGSAL
jgi:hypothetical protein